MKFDGCWVSNPGYETLSAHPGVPTLGLRSRNIIPPEGLASNFDFTLSRQRFLGRLRSRIRDYLPNNHQTSSKFSSMFSSDSAQMTSYHMPKVGQLNMF